MAANKLDANGHKRHAPFLDGPQSCIAAHLAKVCHAPQFNDIFVTIVSFGGIWTWTAGDFACG